MPTADIAVIGCGGMGAACLLEFTDRRVSVVGFDAHNPPHTLGSSHGDARVIRKAYFEHPDYVPLLHTAFDRWRSLEQRAERSLFSETGVLIGAPPDAEVIRGTMDAAERHQLPLEHLSTDDVRQRFPCFRPPEDLQFLFEACGGYLRVEDCIRAQLDLAKAGGAGLVCNTPVTEIRGFPDRCEIRTAFETWTVRHAVITAGPWLGQLHPAYTEQLRLRRKLMTWFPLDSTHGPMTQAPVYFFETTDGQFYGFPTLDNRHVRLGKHDGGDTPNSPEAVRREITPDELEPMQRFVESTLCEVRPQPQRASVCLYTDSPDGHFLVDRYSEQSLTVLGGFSGHGYKFASVLSIAAADLALDGSSPLPIGFLSSRRLS